MDKPVAVVGPARDPHVPYVCDALEKIGVPAIVLDTEKFPSTECLEWTPARVVWNDRDLTNVRSVYLRNLMAHPAMDPAHDATMKENWYATLMAFREKASALAGLLDAVACPIVNPPAALEAAHKPVQLRRFRDAGIPVPETIVTNDGEALKKFVSRFGKVIYKPVAGGATVKPIEPKDLTPERLQLLRNAPVQFQEFVPGENIRVYVVGNQVAAAAVIETTDEFDFRRAEGIARLIRLPKLIELMCLRAAEVSRLAFTGIDIKRHGDRFVFLEANPSPMFFGFDRKTGAGVGARLADYLACF